MYLLVLPLHLAVPCCQTGALNTHVFAPTYLNCRTTKPAFSFCDSKHWAAARSIAWRLFLSWQELTPAHTCILSLCASVLAIKIGSIKNCFIGASLHLNVHIKLLFLCLFDCRTILHMSMDAACYAEIHVRFHESTF